MHQAARMDSPPAQDAGAAAAARQPQANTVARTGYQGFGSFHSGNVEDMISDAAWQPPANPCASDCTALAGTPLGAACRPNFLVDFRRRAKKRERGQAVACSQPSERVTIPRCRPRRWTFVNHGAFGAALRCAHDEAEAWRRRCEGQPLLFLDRWARQEGPQGQTL
jgi:hypothetical protein